MKVDKVLDATGLHCPLPILKAKVALRDMAVGEILKVVATDPAAKADFEAFCAVTGHRLCEYQHRSEQFIFMLEKMS